MNIGGCRFEWNDAAVMTLLNGPSGPVYKHIAKAAFRVRGQAIRLCPVDTGRLRDSITVWMGHDRHGPYGDIGSNVEYAYFVHEGTIYMYGRPFLTDALPAANL